jgi:hypothetical protein
VGSAAKGNEQTDLRTSDLGEASGTATPWAVTAFERREGSMTALVVVATSLAVGASLGRWWALALPLVGIGLFAGAESVLGPSWGMDTPVVAIAVVSEVALAAGVVVRRRLTRVA